MTIHIEPWHKEICSSGERDLRSLELESTKSKGSFFEYLLALQRFGKTEIPILDVPYEWYREALVQNIIPSNYPEGGPLDEQEPTILFVIGKYVGPWDNLYYWDPQQKSFLGIPHILDETSLSKEEHRIRLLKQYTYPQSIFRIDMHMTLSQPHWTPASKWKWIESLGVWRAHRTSNNIPLDIIYYAYANTPPETLKILRKWYDT